MIIKENNPMHKSTLSRISKMMQDKEREFQANNVERNLLLNNKQTISAENLRRSIQIIYGTPEGEQVDSSPYMQPGSMKKHFSGVGQIVSDNSYQN